MALFKVTRRELLMAGAASGLAGAAGLVLGYFVGEDRERWRKRVPPRVQPFAPSVFLAIDESGEVTIWVSKSEMGQGVHTALPMLVAEELDADWSRIRIEQALGNPNYGGQLTGNSSSVRGMWDALRTAGAGAREMLVAAAAAAWGVAQEDCTTDRGFVVHRGSGRRIGYGQLVRRAAALEVPSAPRLKAPSEFKLIGKRIARLDIPAKVDGSAVFGLDVRRPGMLFAVVARCPILGGKLARFDDARARAVPGVRRVFAIASGVAVVADNTWAAMQGRDALELIWDEGPHADFSTETVRAQLQARKDAASQRVRSDGDPEQQLAAAKDEAVVAEYEVPFLAHATMEPINCTAHIANGRCEIWAPTQAPDWAQETAARITGLELANVIVHVPLIGGGFGRRVADTELREVLEIAGQLDAPVQLVWTREDDVRHDHYRPASLHRLRAALAQGAVTAWHHRVISPAIGGADSEKQLDEASVEGARDVPYAVPHLAVEWVSANMPVQVGFWRSVAHSFNAFAIECFVDELAERAGKDPVELRRELLRDAPRHRGVLDLAAERAGWGTPPPAGRARGIALHASFGSYVAMVAELALDAEQQPRVERVVAAVDCGLVVNPDIVEAQIEGGIVFGLSAALYGQIDFDKGRVVQSNFHDYPLLRIDRMPAVEVHIVRSSEPPGGVGEIGVPPIAPAVCNALYALTKQRVRKLPLVRA